MIRAVARSFSTKVPRVHEVSSLGFISGSADSYNQGRPSYSAESVSKIVNALKGADKTLQNKNFLELGAGTGKFTFSLLDHLKESSEQIKLCVTEPSDGFLTSLITKFDERYKDNSQFDLSFKNWTSTAIEADSNSFDGIFVAQAFHWMASEASLVEILRVLKSGAPLVLIWNTYDYSEKWVKDLEQQVLEPAYYREKPEDEVPRQQSGKWVNSFNDYEKDMNAGNIKNFQVFPFHSLLILLSFFSLFFFPFLIRFRDDSVNSKCPFDPFSVFSHFFYPSPYRIPSTSQSRPLSFLTASMVT